MTKVGKVEGSERAGGERLAVCLVGCGAIGRVIAHAIDDRRAGSCRLEAIYDLKMERSQYLADKLSSRPQVLESPDSVLTSATGLVVEAASQQAVSELGCAVLDAGKDLMVMSVGALVTNGLLDRLQRSAISAGGKIYLPSGALCGLDGIKAACEGRMEMVRLTSTKNPLAFHGVDYLREQGIDPAKIDKATVLFDGPAREAAQLFPRNINVCAALAVAGIGPDRTWVRLIADPDVECNIHRVEARGDFGSLRGATFNVTSPDNPKTSYLAALSAVATLRKITDPIQIGT